MKNLRSKIFLPFLASFFLGLVLTGTAFGITNSKLNGSLGSGGRVRFNFQISPNSNLVTYRARQDDKNLEELYSVPIAGDEVPIKLSPLVSVPDGGGSVTIRENNISPDGNRVVFKIARTNPNPAPGTSFRENFIYSTPIDGSVEPVRLNVPADPQSFTVLGGVSISRDSNWVVYETSIAPSFGGPLTSIPIDGSKMPITLAEGDDINTGWRISPDNSRVVYASDSELFSIAIDGSSMPVRLTPPRDMGGEKVIFDGITISPDSRRVLYTAYEVSNQSETDIFSVPIDGSAVPVKLNIANGGGVSPDFLITPDGNRVVYRARQGVLSFTRLTPNTLYSAPLDGSTMPVKLTLPFPDSAFEGVTNFQISPDGKRAVYNAINDFQNNTRGFYSVLIDGSAMPVKLSSSFPFAFISDLIISPDSKRVVFNARLDTALIRELYSVPIEGGVPPIILNPPGPSGDDIVFSTQFSSNGSRVIYSAELETDGVRELYSVPIDGSVIPVKLNVPLVTGGDVGDFKVSLDDNYVVYTADQDTDEVTELYSTLLVFDVDIENIIYIINHFPEEDLDVELRDTLISNLEEIESQACAGNISEAINQLQEFKISVEALGQNIKKTSADIINAGVDYSLMLWKSVNNQELNPPAFDLIVDNNKLIDLINGLSGEDIVDNQKSSLVAMLESAEQEAISSNIGASIQKLQTFKSEVETLTENGINSATADNLISNADNLIDHLNDMLLNVQACST